MKNLTEKIIEIGVILAILLSNVVMAATSKDITSIDKQINEKKEQLNNIQEEKSSTMQEVENITSKISEYEMQINELNTKISDLNNQIDEAQSQLDQAQEDFTKQEELLKNRLIATYEAGETTYLDVILSSKGLTDFISNYYLIQEIAQNDKKLLDEIQDKKEQIENAKKTLEDSKTELNTSKTSKQNVQNQLSVAKKEKDQRVAQLSESEKETQAEIDKFEQDKAQIRAEIQARSHRPSNEPISPNALTGFMRPVSAGVTCGYLGYSGHYGIDFGASYGTPVLASKAGTVYKSVTKTGGIPNYGSNGNYVGSFSSYGEYIIIDHEDGTMTLYAHGMPGSRLVSEGQRVSQGQQIMSVGNTGNVRPRPSPSAPTNGTHLHFEIYVNGSQVNPANYI